ncbi:hypothetical protein A5893_14450 [Pedobacter psychrophilus]|uniref:Glycosyltransferase 2-like domain-containing protein n=1 Tax=Pedobacter psychrophilus TaxID=1826909 RepID=A0A179DDL0_9SPHI|nr:glycosyltransferase [Pedobacter psychrophilus]OAQ38609.1 hypothetical protein A5893_14450 [Pedobacter psychrophilus]
MKEETKITVIVPSYNQGDYIENCIKSVIQQDYHNWELIIQDGASTDSTIFICEKYAALDNRIIFSSEKDKGFADAVNKALNIASGTLGVIQSSDDFFAQNCVFKDANNIYNNNNKDLNIIAGASLVVNEDLELLATQERIEKYVPLENIYTLRDHFSQGATFFSLLRAKEINYLDSTVDMVADTDFWIRMACITPVKINTVYQTSKIWGAVTVQPEQRSGNLSKFYYGRALMGYVHTQSNRLGLSKAFKQNHANELIIAGIEHFKGLALDVQDFLSLYKELNKKDYILEPLPISLKMSIKKMFYTKKGEMPLNSKADYYTEHSNKASRLNMRWFS